MFLTKDRVLMG